MKSQRLYNLSSFSMVILGVLVAAGALGMSGAVADPSLGVLRLQGVLTGCLLLELGLLFKLYAALGVCHRGAAESSHEQTSATRQLSLFKISAFTFLVIGALNLAITLNKAPTGRDVAAAREVSLALATKVSSIGADMITTGLALTVGYLLLGLFSLASALTMRFQKVEERTGW